MDREKTAREAQNANDLADLLSKDMEVVKKLVNDERESLKRSFPQLKERDILAKLQPQMRILIRTEFAAIEGFCHKLKHLGLLLCDDRGKRVTKKERACVLEKTTQKGRTVTCHLETKENIKFAFKIFLRAFGLQYKMASPDKWQQMCKSVRVRNRLTHPKNPADMEISEADYRDIRVADEWFYDNLKSVLSSLAEIYST
jgi:hypothetical protein